MNLINLCNGYFYENVYCQKRGPGQTRISQRTYKYREKRSGYSLAQWAYLATNRNKKKTLKIRMPENLRL